MEIAKMILDVVTKHYFVVSLITWDISVLAVMLAYKYKIIKNSLRFWVYVLCPLVALFWSVLVPVVMLFIFIAIVNYIVNRVLYSLYD